MIQRRRLVFGEVLLASSLDTFWYPCYEKTKSQREAKRKGMEENHDRNRFHRIPNRCDGNSGLAKIRYLKKFWIYYGSNWVKTVAFANFYAIRIFSATKCPAGLRATVLSILLSVDFLLQTLEKHLTLSEHA